MAQHTEIFETEDEAKAEVEKATARGAKASTPIQGGNGWAVDFDEPEEEKATDASTDAA